MWELPARCRHHRGLQLNLTASFQLNDPALGRSKPSLEPGSAVSHTSSFYLLPYVPPCYADDTDTGACNLYSPPDEPDQSLNDYWTLPVCGPPIALSPAAYDIAAPGSLDTTAEAGQFYYDGPAATNNVDDKWPGQPVNQHGKDERGTAGRRKHPGSPTTKPAIGNSTRPCSSQPCDGGAPTAPAGHPSDAEPAASSREPRLRGFKRARKPSAASGGRRPLPPESDTDQRREARNTHNLIEKKYRDHLNREFELLLSTLVHMRSDKASEDEVRTLSKAAVLKLARQTLARLESLNRMLNCEVERLAGPAAADTKRRSL